MRGVLVLFVASAASVVTGLPLGTASLVQLDDDGFDMDKDSNVPTNEDIAELESELNDRAKVEGWDEFERIKKLTLYRHINRPEAKEIWDAGYEHGSQQGYEAGYNYGYSEEQTVAAEPSIDKLNEEAREGANANAQMDAAIRVDPQKDAEIEKEQREEAMAEMQASMNDADATGMPRSKPFPDQEEPSDTGKHASLENIQKDSKVPVSDLESNEDNINKFAPYPGEKAI